MEVVQFGGNGLAQIRLSDGNPVAQLQAVFFDFVLEGTAADTEEFGCLGSILVGSI